MEEDELRAVDEDALMDYGKNCSQEDRQKKIGWYEKTRFGEEVDNHLKSLAELAHEHKNNMFTIFGDAGYCTVTSSFDNASAFMTMFSSSLRHIVKDKKWLVAMMVIGLKSLPDETIKGMLMENDDERLYAMLAETFAQAHK